MTENIPPTTLFWKSAYETHGPAVLSFLRGRLNHGAGAEDLLQDTFVQAIKAGAQLHDSGKIRSYLFRTAHNLLINYVKRPKVVPFTAIDNGDSKIHEIASSGQSAEMSLSNRELEEAVRKMLESMPEQHRIAFQLAIMQERSYREIAEQTGWTEAQVKINVYRARRTAIEVLHKKYRERSKS